MKSDIAETTRGDRIEALLAAFDFATVRRVLSIFNVSTGKLCDRWRAGSPTEQELRETARELLESASGDLEIGHVTHATSGFVVVRHEDYRLELLFSVAEAHEAAHDPTGSSIRQ